MDPTKSYQVFVTWTAAGNHATDAPFTVCDGTTALATVQMNQQPAPDQGMLDGQEWQSLGVFQASTGSLTVSVSDAANGYVVADAVCAVSVPATTSPTTLVDNADPGYAESGSSWQGWTSTDNYQGDCRYAPAGTGQNTATWTFQNLDTTAQYQVYATWNASGNHATDAPFTVCDGTTALATVHMNQQPAPDRASFDGQGWQSIGVFNPSSGALNIQLSDNANGYVVADAVRLVKITPTTTPVTLVDNADPGYAESGSSWQGWTSTDNYQGDCRYAPAGTGQNTATWTFQNLDPTKHYEVYATWNSSGNHATNAPYTVYDGTTALATVQINQQPAPSARRSMIGRGRASANTVPPAGR